MSESFRIDLRKLEGDGAFPCPKCRNVLDPEDKTDDNFTVTDININKKGTIEEILLRCNSCASQIRLYGFPL